MRRFTNQDMKVRADYMTKQTGKEWEYEQGNSSISYKFVCGSVTLRANTKRELVDTSHSFMEGFFFKGDK